MGSSALSKGRQAACVLRECMEGRPREVRGHSKERHARQVSQSQGRLRAVPRESQRWHAGFLSAPGQAPCPELPHAH